MQDIPNEEIGHPERASPIPSQKVPGFVQKGGRPDALSSWRYFPGVRQNGS